MRQVSFFCYIYTAHWIQILYIHFQFTIGQKCFHSLPFNIQYVRNALIFQYSEHVRSEIFSFSAIICKLVQKCIHSLPFYAHLDQKCFRSLQFSTHIRSKRVFAILNLCTLSQKCFHFLLFYKHYATKCFSSLLLHTHHERCLISAIWKVYNIYDITQFVQQQVNVMQPTTG